ncbi:MAG: hypothetical protein F6J90_34410 [Moorea sp. SIOASIH]|uniref:hypothetical protein n=1 Tax=Moorena sp. SIOASIH TaxID=2607817 RepID=UPI0013BA3C44|nr:hypothetical protein [Moorena sp. SIOASIH]NEO41145.1 hypothetical protein [Moorena sp. SIOASIH]
MRKTTLTLPTPDSRLPTPDSLLPTPDSLLPTPYSLLPKTHRCKYLTQSINAIMNND